MKTTLLEILFFFSLGAIYYIYDGYLRLLQAMIYFRKGSTHFVTVEMAAWPKVTVLVVVRNEENAIVDRIKNILECDYPVESLEILVASDGSTDGTEELVRGFRQEGVQLIQSEGGIGKTGVQNLAVEKASGEIIVFTDADTRFERNFLKAIVSPFSDPDVGCVDGHLSFHSEGNGVSQSQGFYWNYEMRLREAESRLGILAVASGACLALRRVLFRRMEAAYGEDCIVPLEVVLQGKKVLHVADALAYDRMNASSRGEFRGRVRMTLRNWQGTWSRPDLLNPFKHPGYALSLWSHKILRWLSPFFLLLLTLSALALAIQGSKLYLFVFLGIVFFFFSGLLGYLAERKNLKLPLVVTIYSFLLANAGFLVGILRAMRGDSVSIYK